MDIATLNSNVVDGFASMQADVMALMKRERGNAKHIIAGYLVPMSDACRESDAWGFADFLDLCREHGRVPCTQFAPPLYRILDYTNAVQFSANWLLDMFQSRRSHIMRNRLNIARAKQCEYLILMNGVPPERRRRSNAPVRATDFTRHDSILDAYTALYEHYCSGSISTLTFTHAPSFFD